MTTLDQNTKTEGLEDPRAPRRVLSADEGEALLRRLAEPALKPTPAVVEAIRTRKRLLSESSAK